MNLEKIVKLLQGIQTVAVLCCQFGDSGKGKVVDLLTEVWADEIYRGTGGDNAGHTVIIGGKKYVFHLIPSGILHDSRGVANVLGNGMVINLEVLVHEMDTLQREGHTYNNLRISGDAHVILPFQIQVDREKNQSQVGGGIGSTGKGVGPAYEDKIGRRGIPIWDLFNRTALAKKLEKLKERYEKLSQHYQQNPIDLEAVMHHLQPYAERIQPLVHDTVTEVHESLRKGKKILLEGAQGLLLSSEHGTYPYNTGSDCSLNGTASGVGLSATDIQMSLGLIKFPFMSRVGGGSFPTELGGRQSELYSEDSTKTREVELQQQDIPFTGTGKDVRYDPTHPAIIALMNSADPFLQGMGIRLAADEFGSTTGRPRRMGWTDLVSAKYATTINRSNLLVLTKPDVLAGIKEFKLCTEYRRNGTTVPFTRNDQQLRAVEPQYENLEGYGSLEGITAFERLPGSLQRAISCVEEMTGVRVGMIGTGAERDRVIVTA